MASQASALFSVFILCTNCIEFLFNCLIITAATENVALYAKNMAVGFYSGRILQISKYCRRKNVKRKNISYTICRIRVQVTSNLIFLQQLQQQLRSYVNMYFAIHTPVHVRDQHSYVFPYTFKPADTDLPAC